jgi:hypothetical protein
MTTRPLITHDRTTDCRTTGPRDKEKYALCRGPGFWEVAFEGRQATFKHEQGAPYAAWLLLHPPRKPIHALALALDARTVFGRTPGAAEVLQQQYLGLDEAEAVRNLRRQERELEAVLDDDEAIEPVKAEALRELEAIYDFMRKHPWRSRDCIQRCAQAVSLAIRCLHARLATAVDREGKPDSVLRAFARHLHDHLLVPSDGGGIRGRQRVGAALPGWFTYEPPAGVVWEVLSLEPKVQSPKPKAQCLQSEVSSLESKIGWRTAAVGYLTRFLCVGFVLALLGTGCTGPRPLKGGKAVTTHKPAGVIEQTLVQGENASQATKQDQENVKVRTYTVPTGSWVESRAGISPALESRQGQAGRPPYSGAATVQVRPDEQQPSTTFVLSAPMPVVEREETRARTELGAAQKDTAREIGARLSSLKGIVWVGAGLFVFGLASLVWPPLKVIIGSVTTSAALMLGGVALMVLPSMVVGNELVILGGVAVAVGGWFLAHRHGELRGVVGVKRDA